MENKDEFKIKKYVALAVFISLMIFLIFKNVHAQATYAIEKKVQQETYVYRDLGTYKQAYPDGSSIGVHAYILKGSNNSGYYDQYSTCFTLVAESTSIYKNQNISTWLYGTRVFMNGVEVSANQYPAGLTAYIKTTPTVVYYWYTNDQEIGKYYFSWESSSYEIK